jgi:UDP-N-acetylmuramate dehydrogenase
VNEDIVLTALQAAGIKRAEKNASMARQTSWRIGGPADYLCVVDDERQLEAAIGIADDAGLPWLVLGGGNNVLVADAGIAGLVILNRLRGIKIEDGPRVACGAGVFFARAAQFTAMRGYTGMEWGIAIPGTVGGGVVNNAGAHGSDISRSLVSADVIDPAGRRERLTPVDLAYRYRQSALKTPHTQQSRLVVTSCRFRLEPAGAAQATARVEELLHHRLRTQPVKEASAGSTFKNPEGQHAGALIDRAGLKGHRVGGARISPLHANFILNLGSATASDVVALIRLAQSRVWSEFGVRLEPEVQFVGRWPEEMLRSLLEAA